jgi:hypothetical protein
MAQHALVRIGSREGAGPRWLTVVVTVVRAETSPG